MRFIKISEEEEGKGVKIEVSGIDPITAMNFLTAAMVSALTQIQPIEKNKIVNPTINQSIGINKNRLN